MELRKTLAVWLTVMTAACSCNREAFKPVDNAVFIQDARLEEAGQTLSPGDAFHLHGIGCQQTDNVMLDKEGFHIMEDIAAESLIPFRAGSDAGYIATYGGVSLFRLVNPENGTIGQAIYTCKIGQIISATSNSEKPGHILLNVSETSNGLQIYDLAWNDTKSLSHITLPNSANDYAEVLMAN